MNRRTGLALASMMAFWAHHAHAQAMTGLFSDIIPYITEFVNMLYLAGVAGVVIGGIWAAAKWYNTREFSEGWQGMLTVGISAVWLFFIVPKLVANVPTFTRGF